MIGRHGLPLLTCLIAALIAQAALGIQDLSFRSTVQTSKDPLTTENAWKLDPAAENPHRRNWVLKRSVRLVELKAVPVDNAYFRPALEGVLSEVTVHLRNEPQRYSAYSDFPCTREPYGPFATESGSLQAAEEAARLWNQALSAARDELAVRLGRIRADGPEKTLRIANYQFKQWLRDVEERWSAKADERSRAKEWAYYRKKASEQAVCKAGAKAPASELRWRDLMDKVTAKADTGELLVRVPARRMNGVFALRGTIEVGGMRLNGQFMIDTSSPHSMISPSWIESQGMNPRVLEAFSQASGRVNWAGGSAVGKRVVVDSLELSSYPFDLDEFYLVETKIFLPPESVSPCCDGVLGRDFLMNHPIEFNPGVERDFVRIFARRGFSRAAGTPWVEAAVEQGRLISQCVIEGKQGLGKLRDVSWLTASPAGLAIPAESRDAGQWKGATGAVRCGGARIIGNVPAEIIKGLPAGPAAVGVGMAVLGRGPFTLDLAHGRIWLSEESLGREIESNRSGLVLDFTLEKGERTLRVKEIRPAGPAAGALLKAGIEPGAKILEINGKDVSELDLWAANRFFTGAKGDQVTLKIARKNADKLVPVRLR